MRRLIATTTTAVLAAVSPLCAAPAWGDQPTTIHVSASAGAGGNGSSASPYATLKAALDAAKNGDTIEVSDGTYREGELYVEKDVTVRAANGAKPVLSGAKVPTSWSSAGNSTWATPHDMVRFCTVCTTNADPSVEGMAAHPEQVFVDGKPLTQVATRGEVKADTFFVDDPDPITLKNPKNNHAGYNEKPRYGASYVIGVDPSKHRVEVVQHSRAATLHADGITFSGFSVEKYSPVQRWDYRDPEIGTATGGAMFVASGKNFEVSNNSFAHSAAGTAFVVTDASNSMVSNNRFVDNGGVGSGINRSSDITFEHNYWSNNNTAGFISAKCGAYCTLSDMKVTHAERIRYQYNTVDYSTAGVDHSDLSSFQGKRQAAIWFDEGVLDSQIIGSRFVNVPTAIFDEVSRGNTIASNVIEGAGIGIQISGSENSQVWNNTISHALTSIIVQEDKRSDGCNSRNADGSCAQVEKWSSDHGLTWDTTNVRLYNNILSSEQQVTEGDVWRYSAMMQVTGEKDQVGGEVYGNQMVSGIDHNVYYRQPVNVPSTTVLWQYGPNRLKESVNAAKLSEFTSNPSVRTEGKEASGVDLTGSREANPVIREPKNPTAWKSTDLKIIPGGPADGTGRPLPQDVAGFLGLKAGEKVNRGALVNVAWGDAAR